MKAWMKSLAVSGALVAAVLWAPAALAGGRGGGGFHGGGGGAGFHGGGSSGGVRGGGGGSYHSASPGGGSYGGGFHGGGGYVGGGSYGGYRGGGYSGGTYRGGGHEYGEHRELRRGWGGYGVGYRYYPSYSYPVYPAAPTYYFCASANLYYPDVPYCPEGWQIIR